MKKKIAKLAGFFLTAAVLTACGNKEMNASKDNTGITTEAEADDGAFKVTFITSPGGLGDRSFNDSAWVGVQRAEKEFGADISIIETKQVSDFGTSIISAVNNGAQLIIGYGGSWTDAFGEYCEKFPEVKFGGLNCTVEADNLQMAQSADHEGSFLAGALAAMMSKTGTVGVVGGQDAVNINRFVVGYEEGAKYVNPDIQVLKTYVGSFNDPVKGKEYALQLKNEGADVIFHVAAGSGEGVFEAAKENEDLYAIGVDGNQDYIVEGKILTSMVKNCDIMAYDMIKTAIDGTFENGYKVYGLENNGVGLTEMEYTKDLIGEENLAKLDEIRKKIVGGEIKVTDLFEQ